MPIFKKGDKVRVRLDSNLPLKGNIGTIEENVADDSSYYRVRLEISKKRTVYFFLKEDLELVN